MLNLLNDYVATLNSEIESYEQLLATKRQEAQKLAQIQGQAVEALGQLKEVVDELQRLDPDALATLKTAALQIFDNSRVSAPDLPSAEERTVEIASGSPALEAYNRVETAEPDASLERESERSENLEAKPPQSDQPAESEVDGHLAPAAVAFSHVQAQGLEVGRQVLIHSSRYRGKYNGQQGAIASEPSAYGVKVDVGDGEPVFFLKDEVSLAA
jgi:hypothetical protein